MKGEILLVTALVIFAFVMLQIVATCIGEQLRNKLFGKERN